VQDFLFAVPRLPDRGEKYRAQRFETVGGGPAATAAVAIARLGGEALLAARVGDDSVADLIVAELEGYGVDCAHVRRCEGSTSSVSSVCVDAQGRRMIVNYLDPRLPADPAWLPEPRALGVAAVLADTRWPEGAAHALGAARRAGLPAILDADRPVPPDGALVAAATHAAFSADGLADFARESDPVVALRSVVARFGNWCCVTVGEAGAYVARGADVVHVPGFAVEAVDTLGAGDVWHGAFALALAQGLAELEAVRRAAAAAALKVTRFGGRAGVPERREVEAFLIQREDTRQ
jgi:sulfofructose kinase